MAQFTLTWDNTDVIGNTNVTGQRASYQVHGGSSWTSTGFTPANDLTTSAKTTDTPVLLDNVVYAFKVEAICTVGGLVPNDNGFPEGIAFACITPTLTVGQNSCLISIDVTGTSITAVRLTLIRSTDNAVLINKFRVNRVSGANTISFNKTGLTTDADGVPYYWQYELYATIMVNGAPIEVISSAPNYRNSMCSPYPFTTTALPQCDSVTGLTVSAKVI